MAIKFPQGAKISTQLTKALDGLDSLPYQTEIIFDRSFDNRAPEIGFSVKSYDAGRKSLHVSIRAKKGVGQHVYVRVDREHAPELVSMIEAMNQRKDDYFPR